MNGNRIEQLEEKVERDYNVVYLEGALDNSDINFALEPPTPEFIKELGEDGKFVFSPNSNHGELISISRDTTYGGRHAKIVAVAYKHGAGSLDQLIPDEAVKLRFANYVELGRPDILKIQRTQRVSVQSSHNSPDAVA